MVAWPNLITNPDKYGLLALVIILRIPDKRGHLDGDDPHLG